MLGDKFGDKKNSHFAGLRKTAIPRIKSLAEQACATLPAEELNHVSYLLAMFIDYRTGANTVGDFSATLEREQAEMKRARRRLKLIRRSGNVLS